MVSVPCQVIIYYYVFVLFQEFLLPVTTSIATTIITTICLVEQDFCSSFVLLM